MLMLEIMLDATLTGFNPELLNFIGSCLGIFAIYMLFYIVLIMLTCKGLYKKANIKENLCFIPVYNLIILTKISELNTFFVLLFFIPGLNFIFLFILFYKLNNIFNGNITSYLGLLFLPFIFLPILSASSKYIYKKEETPVSVKDEMPTIAKQEDIEALNNEVVEEEKPDSIFKSDIEMMEEVEPYKAKSFSIAEIKEEKNKEEIDLTLEIVDLSK